MATFCYRCPCGNRRTLDFRGTDTHPVLCGDCGRTMLRDYKAEAAQPLRAEWRAVPHDK